MPMCLMEERGERQTQTIVPSDIRRTRQSALVRDVVSWRTHILQFVELCGFWLTRGTSHIMALSTEAWRMSISKSFCHRYKYMFTHTHTLDSLKPIACSQKAIKHTKSQSNTQLPNIYHCYLSKSS